MKKKWFLMTLTAVVGLSLAACALPGASKTSSSSSTSSSTKTSKQAESKSSSSSEANSQSSTGATKRVGSYDYGYISIPENWIKFTDLAGGDNIQYTDGSGYNIVTMNAFDREKANVPQGEELTAENISQRSAYFWSQDPKTEQISGAKTTVAGIEAYQLNVLLKSGQYITIWNFKKDDKVYHISFEGDRATLLQFAAYIEDTWSLNKDDK